VREKPSSEAGLAWQDRFPPERYAVPIVDLLESALQRAPDDLDAWEAKGEFFRRIDRPREALAAYESVLARTPERETSLAGAATAAQQIGQTERAVGYWRRAVAANPWMALYRAQLVRNLAAAGAWDELGPHCRAWVRLAPGDAEGRRFLSDWLRRSGQPAEAEAEAARAEALRQRPRAGMHDRSPREDR
jgi:tetratricopeptide (TPR) repeat protein